MYQTYCARTNFYFQVTRSTNSYTLSEVKTKGPFEAKTKKTHSAERDLKKTPPFSNQHHKDLFL